MHTLTLTVTHAHTHTRAHTHTHTHTQCSLCLPGFSGNPRDNGQCYSNIPISTAANFSLPANQTTAFSFGPRSDGYFFTHVNVRAGFVVTRGLIDVYISTNHLDVKVILNRDTWTHQLSFRQGVVFLTSSSPINVLGRAQAGSRSIKSVSEFHRALDDSIGVSVSTGKEEESNQKGGRVRRAQQLSSLSSAQNLGLYHFAVDERLSLIIPYQQNGFQSSDFFVTVFAREDSEFVFYYRQDMPRLNLFVFFSIFLCLFMLVSTVFICAYQLLLFILRRRRRQRQKQRQKRRANRPMVKVVVYFGDKKQIMSLSSRKKKTVQPDPEHLKMLDTVTADADTEILKSTSKDREEERNENPMIVIRKAKNSEKRAVNSCDEDCSCSKIGGEIELETREPLAAATAEVASPKDHSSEGQKKRKKYQILLRDDIKHWPMGIEPTADEAVCLSTMLIQLPMTSSANLGGGGGGQLCMGTALLDYPKASLEERESHERRRRRLRFRKRNRLAPAPAPPPNSSSTTNTSQV